MLLNPRQLNMAGPVPLLSLCSFARLLNLVTLTLAKEMELTLLHAETHTGVIIELLRN